MYAWLGCQDLELFILITTVKIESMAVSNITLLYSTCIINNIIISVPFYATVETSSVRDHTRKVHHVQLVHRDSTTVWEISAVVSYLIL